VAVSSLSSAATGAAGLAGTAIPGDAAGGLALDARALASLRQSAEVDPQGSIRKAAGQFEALFMQQLLKSMRAAIPKSGMFDGPGSEMYTGMLDSQLTQAMAGAPGGLADLIAKQMSRHLGIQQAREAAQAAGNATAAAAAGAAGAAAAGASTDQAKRAGAAESADTADTADAAARAAEARALDSAYGRNRLEDAGELQASLARRLGPAQAAFVEQMWPHALAAQEKTGLPAAFVVGQAALESGWGRRDIRDADGNPSHNLFGIKATGGWQGKTVAVLTTEYVDGKPRKVVEQFRKYDSFAEAFTDWSRLMTRSARYADVLKAGNAAEFARGLEDAGYATDPRYSEKLERTINQALRFKRLAM
jgi:peptidoglycan hydrolase FlgJ